MTEHTELPEAPYTGIVEGYSPPEGYWLVADIVRHLLAVWWGERSKLTDTTLLGVTASYARQGSAQRHQPLCILEQQAQQRTAIDVLWQALIDGTVKSRFEDSSGVMRVVARDAWVDLTSRRAHDFLGQGCAWAMGGGEPELGENDRYFLFEPCEAKAWLNDLKSQQLLPDPLKRDATELADVTYVSLCEVFHWLAEGVAKDAENCRNEFAQRSEYFHGNLSRLMRVEDEAHDLLSVAEERRFEDFIAQEQARGVRFDKVERQLEETIASGRIAVFGRKEGVQVEVPRHVFSGGGKLIYLHDQIGAGSDTHSDDYRSVREDGEWTGIRFLRSEVETMWGAKGCEAKASLQEELPAEVAWAREQGLPENFPDVKPTSRKECLSVLRGFIDDCVTHDKKPGRDERIKWAMLALGIKRDRAYELLKQVMPPEWSRKTRTRR